MKPDFEQAKEDAKKLLMLLEEPEPGLATWAMFVRDAYRRLSISLAFQDPFKKEK